MKDYWYIPALAGICSVFTKLSSSILITIVLLLWLIVLYSTKRIRKITIVISVATYILFFVFIPQPHLDSTLQEFQDVRLIGEITSSIHTSETLLQFDFQEEKSNEIIRVNFFQPEQIDPKRNEIQYGATCELIGELRIPISSSNPGQFNYQKYLAGQGIGYEMILSSVDDMTCQGSSAISNIYKLREHVMKHIKSHYSEKTSAWILALVVGDDQSIPEGTIELFQRWGLSHILAISGLHIGLVVGILYFFTTRLNFVTKENAQYLVIFTLPIYAILAGGEPSVWRACLMIVLIIILQKFKKRFSTVDAISLTFLVLVFVNPYFIYHVGFQLSFIVTFGIILSKNWFMNGKSLLFQMVKLSFISLLMIIPLQVTYFFNINPLSILLNVLVVPYFTFFVIPFMFFLLVISPIQRLAQFLDALFIFVHEDVFLTILEWIDHYVYFPWITGYFPVVCIIVYYVLLIAMMRNTQMEKQLKAFSYGGMLTLLLLVLIVRPYLSPYGMVTMLDIGQGDAIVIELPYRKGVILVDAGAGFSFEDMEPSETTYKRIIKPFLLSRGINQIDAIIITHEDMDHAGSVPFIVKDFKVGSLIVSPYFEFNQEILKSLAGIEIIRVGSGDVIQFYEKMFTFLSPGVDRKGTNENSLVFQTKLGGKQWLFTGDIDMEAEKAIIHNYPQLQTDILKVAHHGSNTSSNPLFITSTKPQYALISVGKNNRYGHPSNEVLKLFESEDIYILRTDQSGAIMYRFTEDSGTFYQFHP